MKMLCEIFYFVRALCIKGWDTLVYKNVMLLNRNIFMTFNVFILDPTNSTMKCMLFLVLVLIAGSSAKPQQKVTQNKTLRDEVNTNLIKKSDNVEFPIFNY